MPDEELAELVERLKTQRHAESDPSVDAGSTIASASEPRGSVPWDTIGPAAFGAAVLVAFAAGSVGAQAGPLLAVIGALVGLKIGSVVDRRVASVEP